MFTGFQVNLYADDLEPGVAVYAALGFEESYRYADWTERVRATEGSSCIRPRSSESCLVTLPLAPVLRVRAQRLR